MLNLLIFFLLTVLFIKKEFFVKCRLRKPGMTSLSIQWPIQELHIFITFDYFPTHRHGLLLYTDKYCKQCQQHSSVLQNHQEIKFLLLSSVLPWDSWTLFGSLVSLGLVTLEPVPCWLQPRPLGVLMPTDDGEGPGSPADFQLSPCWFPGKGAGSCGQDRCLPWGSFVVLSCSVVTRWYTLPDLSLSSLIIPVICRLISMPSSPTQTTHNETQKWDFLI